jgi:regulator of RNase E activity RraA
MLFQPRCSNDELKAIQQYSSPTVANALETFEVIPFNEGFMTPDIRAWLPGKGVRVGYAMTARVACDQPPSAARPAVVPRDYWQYLADHPYPKIAVHQDIDHRPVGAMWGEVNVNVHIALGCTAAITSGGVRDLPEAAAYDFQFFASCVLVSHAYGHFVDFGGAVRVGGLTVRPGDLIHADDHGVLIIPPEVDLYELARRCEQIEALEREIFALAQSEDFSVDRLDQLWREVTARWPSASKREGQNL